jgi:D-threo-aldose 1-dehydrogenase
MPIASFHNMLPPKMIPLGFGCGGLLGGKHRRESRQLLETALDCGVTYFDTARMYGLGDAEGILGELMPQYRSRIVLTSKAGILPTDRSIFPRLARRGLGLLRKAAPPLRGYIPPPAPAEPRFGVFKISELRKSIETSLKKLRTDHLDILLLHECRSVDVGNPELQEFLHDLKKQGMIKAFGLATGIEETIRIIEIRPMLASVVQIPNNICHMNIRRLPHRPDGLTITHSCLAGCARALMDKLSTDNRLAERWNREIGVDPQDSTELAKLLLTHALRANPGGIILFSSSKPANIRANVRVATESSIDAIQVDGLNKLLENEFNDVRKC